MFIKCTSTTVPDSLTDLAAIISVVGVERYLDVLVRNYKDQGEKSDESTSEVSASFTCQDCGKTFISRQELKEHTH
jgi:hypothetical protein